MALQGKVVIMGKSYGVVQAQYEFSQTVDQTNKPTSRTRGGTITFVMPTTNDEDQMFYRWMDYFNDSDSKLMYTTVTIVAESITVGRLDLAVFHNEWT